MSIKYKKNVWGSSAANKGVDQQRADLFRISLNLPQVVVGGGAALAGNGIKTSNVWDEEISFVISKFPFPDRKREMVPIKYLNQTNFSLGADSQMPQVTVTARYGFNQQAAAYLERWHWMTSHPNGAVARTSQIKTDGWFYWLVPDLSQFVDSNQAAPDNAYRDGAKYRLEGVLLAGLKPSDADMESTNGLVNFDLTIQIDRYFPEKPEDLVTNI